MLLAVDVGNTNITLGLYEGERLEKTWRLETVLSRTSDEYALFLGSLLAHHGLSPKSVSAVIIASVVPSLTHTIVELAHRLFETQPLVVGPGLKTGMPILYNPPKDVGADRIVNGVAAFKRVQGACIVVDFGTATTFDSITRKGEYAGGAIAPGMGISVDALVRHAAKLPRVEIQKPKNVVGKSTVESIQSGLFFGYVGLIDGLVARMTAEMIAEDPKISTVQVLATGGLAPLIAAEAVSIQAVDEFLTLDGLLQLFLLNRSASP